MQANGQRFRTSDPLSYTHSAQWSSCRLSVTSSFTHPNIGKMSKKEKSLTFVLVHPQSQLPVIESCMGRESD